MEQHYERNDIWNAFDRYYSDLRFRLTNFAAAKKKLDIYLSSEFNVLNVINPNENKLSDIISDLLDSSGTHGQGDLFLRLFLSTIGQSDRYISRYRVVREDPTTHISNSSRRIDITLDFGNYGIGVENKPWALDQEDQVKDYVYHLDKKYKGNFALVYIPGDGSNPTSIEESLLKSLIDQGKFYILPYPGQLVMWLHSCVKECESDKYRWFLKDLMKYIDTNFTYKSQDG